MNLFNYLMARQGHNTSPRDDLFAYLLGKIPKVVKEVTGVTIHITDVSNKKIISLWLDKESTQDGTPTPVNPIPVEVVDGYIKDGNNYVDVTIEDGNSNSNVVSIPLNGNFIAGIGDYKDTLMVDENGKCYLNKKITKLVLDGSETEWGASLVRPNTSAYNLDKNIGYKATTGNSTNALVNYFKGIANGYNIDEECFWFNSSGYLRIRINNSIASTVSELKAWLSTHNTDVYYVLEQEELIDLNYTVDLKLFKGENNISNSEDMMMTLKYY